MNPIPSVTQPPLINPVSTAASTATQQTIAALQAQMVRYSSAANGQNSRASSDYNALQLAIKAGNVQDAQAALARLQRDSQAKPAAAEQASTSPTANQEGSTGVEQPRNERSINTTA